MALSITNLRITLLFSNKEVDAFSYWDSIINTENPISESDGGDDLREALRSCVILRTFSFLPPKYGSPSYRRQKKAKKFLTNMINHIAQDNPTWLQFSPFHCLSPNSHPHFERMGSVTILAISWMFEENNNRRILEEIYQNGTTNQTYQLHTASSFSRELMMMIE
jgi:hypothetical protein